MGSRCARAGSAFLGVLLCITAAPARATDEILIRDVLLVDGSGAPPRTHVDVLITGQTIHAIEPTGAVTATGRVIEGSGLTALPGLIDAHVHFVAAPGSAYRHDSDATIRALNRRHLRAYLACGVTTVLDAATYPEVARDIQAWLAAGHPGPRYLTLGPYVRPPDGYGNPRFGGERTVAEVERKLDLIRSLGGAGVKLAIESALGPLGGPAQFTPELRTAVVEGARRRGLPLYVHARTEATQAAALDLGAHALMHAPVDVNDPMDVSDAFVARLAKSGTYQVTTLSLTDTFPALYDLTRLDDPLLRLVVPPEELATARATDAPRRFYIGIIGWVAPWTWEWARPSIAGVVLSKDRLATALRTGQRNLLREHRAGVPLVIGTDAPSPWPDAIYHFHGPQVAREIALVREAGLTPLEAITAATSTPARMLGLAATVGTLAVGRRADVLLVAGDASRDVRALHDVRWTIHDGVAHTPEEWMRDDGQDAAGTRSKRP